MSGPHYFTRVKHGDFMARCADLEGDEVGLYTLAYMLMAERRGPIDDDMAWLAGKIRMSTRRANQIRAKLIDLGKWVLRSGMLGDPAVLAEIAFQNRRSAINQSNALARWDRAGQPQLDLDDETGGTRPKKRRKSANSSHATASNNPQGGANAKQGGDLADKSEKRGPKTPEHVQVIGEESAENSHSPPEFRMSDSRARGNPELERRILPTESESLSPPIERRDQSDIPALLRACCEAAGWTPQKTEHREAALRMVEAWSHDGIDFTDTVLPTIQRTIADSPDPTSSLQRFDRSIRYAHARAAARPASRNGNAPPPPVLRGDDPDPRLATIRTELRREIGNKTFDSWIKPMRMTIDHTSLIVQLPSEFMANWVLEHFATQFSAHAQPHGFTKVIIAAHKNGP